MEDNRSDNTQKSQTVNDRIADNNQDPGDINHSAEGDAKIMRKILLMGYNGANNTGSETRLISIIDEIRNVLGSEILITIPTLNEKNLRRYIKEDSNLIIAPVPSIFFFALKKLVREQDLVLLVEGSCYMDTWTSALLWAFLWTTRCANSENIPCVSYAVDAGDLSYLNRFLVKREASKTDLIITRTKYAAEKLLRIGVTAPIKHTADTAFTFQPKVDHNLNNESLQKNSKGLVGLAVIDFYLWPVVIKPWGKKENEYKWPYYFSRSKKRVKETEDLAFNWAAEADRIIEEYGMDVALICMEEVDEPLANKIKSMMKHSNKISIFSSNELDASQMTDVLRNLDLLVTSRYHAAILSLKAHVPQIALSHDTRLKGLYKDLKLDNEYLIDYIPRKDTELNIWNRLSKKVDELIKNPEKTYEKLNKGYIDHLTRSKENQSILKNFLLENGWDVES